MTKKFNDEMQNLLQKAREGGQVTLSDLENLQSFRRVNKKDPNARPSRILSPKTLLKRAKEGVELNKWELEELAKAPEFAVEYAEFTKKPFPELEDVLLSGSWVVTGGAIRARYFEELFPQVNKKYEHWLIKHKEAERIKAYCSLVLKSRWKEGEKVILADDSWRKEDLWLDYQSTVVKGRWHELEQIIFRKSKKIDKEDRKSLANGYFNKLGLGRHEDLERMLLKSGYPKMLYDYALCCVGGRLPESLHNKMILTGKNWAKRYLKGIEARKRMVSHFLASLTEQEKEEIFRKTTVAS